MTEVFRARFAAMTLRDQRAVILQMHYQHLSVVDIAEATGLSLAVVQVTLAIQLPSWHSRGSAPLALPKERE